MKKLEVLILSILATMFLIACNNAETPSQPQKYTIEYELNGGAWVADYDAPSEYTEGEEVNLPDAKKLTRTGYAFAGWYETEALTGTAITTISREEQGNKKFFAKWNENYYSITVTNNNKILSNSAVSFSILNGSAESSYQDSKLKAGTNVWFDIRAETQCFGIKVVLKTETAILIPTIIASDGTNSNRFDYEENKYPVVFLSFEMPASNVTLDISSSPIYKSLDEINESDPCYPYVTFGEWPQTKKVDSTIAIDETQTKVAGNSTYYRGSDNAWYAKFGDNYYKVEPIKWRLIPNHFESNKRMLVAENILLYERFYDGSMESCRRGIANYYPNNYKESRIRAFLNGLRYYYEDYPDNPHSMDSFEVYAKRFENKGFLYGAFTKEERAKIAITNVLNNARSTNPASSATPLNNGQNRNASDNYSTDDKIFLLSMQEATESGYGFRDYDSSDENNSRIIKATEYANDNIANNRRYIYEGYWWLRSPYFDNQCDAYAVDNNGDASGNYDVAGYPLGVVPALCLE